MDSSNGTANPLVTCPKCAITGDRRVFGRLSTQGDIYCKRVINNKNSSYTQEFAVVFNEGGIFCVSCNTLVLEKRTNGTQSVIFKPMPVTEMVAVGTVPTRVLTNESTAGTIF